VYNTFMWRLHVRKEYLNNVIGIGKFFINRRFHFRYGDILLLLLLKRDDSRHLGRVRALLVFSRLDEDRDEESLLLYGRRWRYKIIARRSIMFAPRDWFDLDDVIGVNARRYYCQIEAMRINDEDTYSIMEKIGKYI